MKKQKNKQGIKASKLAKAENKLKKQAEQMITVKNAEGDPDTQAKILIQNKVNYTPKVSVIIPVYNVEEYLRECLDSVVNQTLKEIEIICVDDGSTDNSLEILKEYAKKDNRISVLTQENLHAGVARNAGLAVAQGEYLSFLDSDDFFELNMLEETYKVAKTENSDLTFYQYKNYNNETQQAEKIAGINKQFPVNEKGYAVLQTTDIATQLFTICNPMPWNKLISHQLVKQEQLFFQSLTASNDVYFSQMILACSQKIVLWYKTFVYYRYNRKSSLKNNRDKYPLNFYYAFSGICNTLKNKNLYEKYYKTFLTSYLSSALWTVEHTDKARQQVKDCIKEKIIPEFSILTKNKNIFSEYMISRIKRVYEPDIIISLTSYPARIGTVNQAIESLLNQTLKADKVILWLAPEQFPNKEKDLPQQLLDLRDKGLTIDWYHDIKSYKKLIPTLQKYPDAIIVTADDDLLFERNWLSYLYNSYLKEKKVIHCHRITRLYKIGNQLKILDRNLYLNKKNSYCEDIKKASYFNKLSGGAGTLYPPHSLHKDVLDEKTFMQLSPTSDDIWFYIQAIRNNYRVKVVDNNLYILNYIQGTQDENCLCKINDINGNKIFYSHLNVLIDKYQDITQQFNEDNVQNKQTIAHIYQNMKIIYKQELQTWYQRVTRKYLNLDNPRTFNEKIQWLKLYDSTPIKTRLADKYLVRDWVKEKIGEQYLIPLLGVYDKFEEIDFEKLPNQFVIKCNHGCAYNIIVKDKTKLDLADVKAKLDKWMSENFAFKCGYELHYRDIKPKIIIEKYIENKGADDLYDYKFWCFDGKVAYIQFLSERNLSGLKMAFYDKDWVKQTFVYSHPLDTKKIEKPNNLDEMIRLAEILSKGFPHVRVDFYRLNDGTIYFGEMTFTSASGSCKWNEEQINLELGKMIKLPKLAYNIDTGEYYKLPKKSKLKPYLLLPYNLFQKAYLSCEERKINRKNIQKQLTNYRIDIKNVGKENNALEITTSGKVSKPAWFINAQGQGQVVESNKKIQNISIKAIQDGKLRLDFKGQDKRFEGTRFPVWADYKSIKIDGKEILSAPISTWHDKPFRYEMPVKDGQVVKVDVVQQYHQYDKDELKDVILKLNPNSEYIKENIKKLTNKIYKKISKYKISKVSQLPIIEADYFIPLGNACRPAFWLKKYGLRQASYPFDWMMSYSLSTVINTITKGCHDWFSNYTEDKSKINAKVRYVVDNTNHIISMHGFPSTCSVEAFLPEFQKTMQRRIERLKGVFSQSRRICILCNRDDTLDAFIMFGKELNKMYPHLNITIINVVNANTRKDIEKYDISKKLKIYLIMADDTNEKGSDKAINPKFWIGNERLYEEICSKFKIVKSSPQTTLFAKVKQNLQKHINLWYDKFSFARKIEQVMDLIQKNQVQTLKQLQDILVKNANLENKNNELKKEIEVLKGTFNTQLLDFKKQQEERSKQLMAIGDRLSTELQRATNELQSAEQSQASEIKATLSDFIAQLAATENKLTAELQRATNELQSTEKSQASEIRATLSEFIAQLAVTENKLSAELQRTTAELQSAEQSQTSEIKATLSEFIAQLAVTENKLSTELQRTTAELQSKNVKRAE